MSYEDRFQDSTDYALGRVDMQLKAIDKILPMLFSFNFMDKANNVSDEEINTVCKTLISLGANVKGNYNMAVDEAARHGFSKAVKTLLDAGAEPVFALKYAAKHNHFEVIKVLLDTGRAFDDYEMCLKFSAEKGHREILKVMLDAVPKGDPRYNVKLLDETLLNAMSAHDFKAGSLLIKAGADPLTNNAFAIKEAIICENEDFIKFVISKITSRSYLKGNKRKVIILLKKSIEFSGKFKGTKKITKLLKEAREKVLKIEL